MGMSDFFAAHRFIEKNGLLFGKIPPVFARQPK